MVYKYLILGKIAAVQAVLQDISMEMHSEKCNALKSLSEELMRVVIDLRSEMDSCRYEHAIENKSCFDDCCPDDTGVF